MRRKRAFLIACVLAMLTSCASSTTAAGWRLSTSPSPGARSTTLKGQVSTCPSGACQAVGLRISVLGAGKVVASRVTAGSFSMKLRPGSYMISAQTADGTNEVSCPKPTPFTAHAATTVMVSLRCVAAGSSSLAPAVRSLERRLLILLPLALVFLAIAFAWSSGKLRMPRVLGWVSVLLPVVLMAGIFYQPFGGSEATSSAHPATAGSPSPSHPSSPPTPVPGFLLVTDRGNSRILLVSEPGQVLWSYPASSTGSGARATAGDFEDAYFGSDYSQIATNLQNNELIETISFPAGKTLFRYGTSGSKGSKPGMLDTPDDPYILANGDVQVADLGNCRVLRISPDTGRVVQTWGSPGVCTHAPPHLLGSPDGDAPLPNGDTLVTEVQGSWVDLLSPSGKIIWAIQAPVSYASDAAPLAGGRVLLVDDASPGAVLIVNRQGHVVWRYGPVSGGGEISDASHAVELPNGYIAIADTGNDRVIVIDPKTRQIVWSYGHNGKPGSKPGYLDHPTCVDFLPAQVVAANPALAAALSLTGTTSLSPSPGASRTPSG